MAPVMLSAQMAKADATRAKPVRGMPTGFELFRDSFDVLERDGSPLRAATDVGVETGGERTLIIESRTDQGSKLMDLHPMR